MDSRQKEMLSGATIVDEYLVSEMSVNSNNVTKIKQRIVAFKGNGIHRKGVDHS